MKNTWFRRSIANQNGLLEMIRDSIKDKVSRNLSILKVTNLLIYRLNRYEIIKMKLVYKASAKMMTCWLKHC